MLPHSKTMHCPRHRLWSRIEGGTKKTRKLHVCGYRAIAEHLSGFDHTNNHVDVVPEKVAFRVTCPPRAFVASRCRWSNHRNGDSCVLTCLCRRQRHIGKHGHRRVGDELEFEVTVPIG